MSAPGHHRKRHPVLHHAPRPSGGALLRSLARRLEVRAIGLVPEHFNPGEGLRAAVAVGVPLVLVLVSGRYELGWSIFAAFWTCLCVAPGSPTVQRRLLALFVALGTLIAFCGSWLASWGETASLVAGPLLVFMAIMLPARMASANLLATLLGVVAVVAVGFPLPAAQAKVEALSFLLGAGWAFALVHGLWRIDPHAPLDLATRAVVARLGDMAASLVATGPGPHRDAQWHRAHGEHRRAVRLALERLGGLLPLFAEDPSAQLAPYLRAHDAAETVFSALIALDHVFIQQAGSTQERLAAARTFAGGMKAWRSTSPGDLHSHSGVIARWITLVRRRRARLRGPLVSGCLLALEQALASLAPGHIAAVMDAPVPPRPVPLRAALRQALRQATGVILVYVAAQTFHLGYPYWGSMAVVVVLQKGTRVTWMRALERICGSLLGGVCAAMLLHIAWPAPLVAGLCVMLAALAIALRSVNYTSFVVFLTVLFVTVTALLHPGEGIPMARIADNTVGSLVALISVLAVWPERRPGPRSTLNAALEANRAYLAAVESCAPTPQMHAARRAAGLASIDLEIALHDPGWLVQRFRLPPAEERIDLATLRLLAGQAATVWHERLAQEPRLVAPAP